MKKIAIISVSVVFVLLTALLLFLLFFNFSKGERAGTISKFSHKGLVIKTWEGQLLIGGLSGNQGSDLTTNTWDFSVYPGDQETREAIFNAMNEGYRVRMVYEQKLFVLRWRGDTEYFVTHVERVPVSRQPQQ